MTEPTPPEPQTPAKKAGPLGLEPWMIAAALGIGAGVVVGLRVAKLLSPPVLPVRQPCPECAQRRLHGRPAPSPKVPAPAPLTDPPAADDALRQFSAQAIPEAETLPADWSAEELPDG